VGATPADRQPLTHRHDAAIGISLHSTPNGAGRIIFQRELPQILRTGQLRAPRVHSI